MNRIYRRAWNRSLRQPQVASELARSPHDGRVGVAAAPRIPRHRPLAWACAVALGVAGMLPLSAWAAQGASTGGSGGAGGGSYAGSGGAGNGTGGQGGAGSLGSAGSGGNGGDGGHGGSVISAGGAGGSVGATSIGGSSVAGGDGVDGQVDPGTSFMSGGGGGGGDGVYSSDAILSLGAGLSIRGGNGGGGGNGDRIGGGGGGGGAGLVALTNAAAIDNAGSISGGDGGNGATGQWSGGGGGGGDGLLLLGGASVLTNTGAIVGGAGGSGGGPGSFVGGNGSAGAGVDLDSDGNTVVNSGSIVGGSNVGSGSGAGILAGNGTLVTNQAGGSIAGGTASGAGSLGGDGIAVTTSGAQTITIDNAGSILGGLGGGSFNGSIPNGTGGQAIAAGGNVTISNGGLIAGGNGGGVGGGRGGTGIGISAGSGEQASIDNRAGGVIEGGYGGAPTSGNFGGTGISASGNVAIVNRAGASILGDDGGLSDISTTGGTAISASAGVGIDNGGLIAGTGGLVAGVAITANAVSIVNRAGGVIAGGNGQDNSAGAAAIVASGGTSIDSSGSIVGGHVDNGGAQADAVMFSGGDNTLLLRAGSSITGNVASNSGSGAGGDSFILGGDIDAAGGNTFDAGTVAGFASYRKTGASRWTLTGNGSIGQAWAIDGGSLVGDSHSLVDNVVDNAALVFDQAFDGSYAGTLSGSGMLAKDGGGVLALTGVNTYLGGTALGAGTLALAGNGTLGDGNLDIADGATFDISQAGTDIRIATLSGDGGMALGGQALTIGRNAANSDFGGVIGDGGIAGGSGGRVVIDGSAGVVAFRGVNTYTGGTTIRSGTLALRGGGALDAAGAVTIDAAGSFDIAAITAAGTRIGDLAGSGSVNLGGKSLTLGSANDTLFAGSIAGSGGALIKQGSGTLVLTGANSYSGGTRIDAGTLQVGDGGTLGTGAVVDNGTLVFDRSDAPDFAGAISGSGALVKQGGGVLTLAGANSYGGGTTITAGTLRGDTASLQGDIVDNGALVFAQAGDGGYAGRLSGSGSLGKTGAGTLTLGGDSHAYAGMATVDAGGLAVDGTLGGTLVMGAGTRLSGNGTLGSLDLAGTLAPGHSIGTLSAGGDVTIRSGAAYEVETDAAGHSDLLAVTGHAMLQGGSVLNLAQDGSYAANTTYTILTAAGGVDGQFAGVTSSLAFLDPTLIYQANAVQLTLQRNQVDFCAVAATANQCATGNAVQHQGGGPLYDALLTQDAATARSALGQWSGESLASTRTALLQDSRFVRAAMSDRLHRAETAQDGARALGKSAGSIWLHGWDHSGHADGDGNASTLQSHGSGVLLGVDAPLGDGLRAGVTGGAGQDSLRVDALDSSAYVKSRHLGVYAGGGWGAWTLDGGAAQSWHDIRGTRVIGAVLPGSVRADYHGRTRQAYLEGGYRYAGAHGSVQPFVNLAHVAVRTGDVNEYGSVTALRSAGETTEVSFGTVGVHGLWQLADSAATPASLYATLGWRHALGDLVPLAQQQFADGERFTVRGVPLTANAALVQLGIDAALSKHASLRAGYDGVLAGSESDHAVRLTLQVAF